MPGFDDLPDTEDPELDELFGSDAVSAPSGRPGESNGDDYFEELAASMEREGTAFSNSYGTNEGPLFYTDRERRANIATWHVLAIHKGNPQPLGDVPVDVTFSQLINLESILYALSKGVREFRFLAQHPVQGYIRALAQRLVINPDVSLEVRQALDAYESDGADDDFDGLPGGDQGPWDTPHGFGSGPHGESLRVIGEIVQGPFEVLLGTMSKITQQQAAHAERVGTMVERLLDTTERSMAKQLEATDVATRVALHSITRTAALIQSDEKHAANLAIAQRKLDLATPFAEKYLMAQLERGEDIDPMILHSVIHGRRMEFMDMVMAGLSRVVAKPPVDIGTVTTVASSMPAVSSPPATSAPAQIEQQPAPPPPAKEPALAASLLRGAETRADVLNALQEANCTLDDLEGLTLSRKQKTRLLALVDEEVEK